MGEKVSGIFLVLMFFLLIAVALGFVYLFTVKDGQFETISIPMNAKILGDSSSVKSDSNFSLPDDTPFIQDDLISAQMKQKIQEQKNINENFNLEIPQLSVKTIVTKSNDTQTLEKSGSILLPFSYEYQDSWLRFPPWSPRKPKTEAIILCYRRFYGPDHPQSCFSLDELELGDEIMFDQKVYTIKAISVVDKNNEAIFEPSDQEEYLKIITTSGISKQADQNSNYLAIIASRD